MINSKEHSSEKPHRGTFSHSLYSTAGSVVLHLIVLSGLIILSRIAENSTGSSFGGYYVDMVSPKGSTGSQKTESRDIHKKENQTKVEDKKAPVPLNEKKSPEKETIKSDKEISKSNTVSSGEKAEENTGHAAGSYYSINSAGFDSTGLSQTYREPTLNVRLRYPSGWVYLDQQRKSRLDGITFWASAGSYNPPPYIHVEVMEKYIFNPEEYKYKYNFERFTGYYNDPEELENQVSQTIYIRTGDEEDYSIKLIMQGHEAFREFQPVFFAMVKSFRFGNSLF